MKVAVVIPCYGVSTQILDVLASIPASVSDIFVVDDGCKEQSGRLVERSICDPRVSVIYRQANGGVGAAVITGYEAAIKSGAEIVVKVDGDGQMDPSQIPTLIAPIVNRDADYCKGNRFSKLRDTSGMPILRIIGNLGMTILAKFSTGYWSISDPTNGFTAIHIELLKRLPLSSISQNYFFETDMLFHLYSAEARVVDVPFPALYANEQSNLRPMKVLLPFLVYHMRNFWFRVWTQYAIKEQSGAFISLVAGLTFTGFGLVFGITSWMRNAAIYQYTSSGAVMIVGLSILIGFQLLLRFIQTDSQRSPQKARFPELISDMDFND